MDDIERLTIALPEPLAAQLRAAVEAGEYASTSEAVQDAVNLWSGRRQLTDPDVERLGEAWDAGKAAGRFGPVDFEELHRESRARLIMAKGRIGRAG